ncbi:MAG: hypothetical protein SFU83_23535 [Meiothermus sp.]|nr:hypothetical protein [Meiothermus sp.]
MRLLTLTLLAGLLGCAAQPQPSALPPQAPPPLVIPIPAPPDPVTPAPPPPPAVEWGSATFTARMLPQWYSYKTPSVYYFLMWRQPDGSWRPAYTYVEGLGVGFVGPMTEARPTVTVRLPAGEYRALFGYDRCAYAYHRNEPWQALFSVAPDRSPALESTLIWEQLPCAGGAR